MYVEIVKRFEISVIDSGVRREESTVKRVGKVRLSPPPRGLECKYLNLHRLGVRAICVIPLGQTVRATFH
jgi:hypothetical protein